MCIEKTTLLLSLMLNVLQLLVMLVSAYYATNVRYRQGGGA